MKCFSKLCLLLILVLLMAKTSLAVMVSPIVIDASQVRQGETFLITLTNTKPVSRTIALSLGWFSLDLDGAVNLEFHPLVESKVEEYVTLDIRSCTLEPGETKTISMSLISAEFSSISPVLAIDVLGNSVSWRLAVLLLLSTDEPNMPLQLSGYEWQSDGLVIELENPNFAHYLFQGQLELYQAKKEVTLINLPSCQLLAKSKRRLKIPIEASIQKVRLISEQLNEGHVGIQR